MNYRLPLLKLAVSLEFFAYTFPVALLAYFVVIGGNNIGNLVPFMLSAGAGSVAALVSSISCDGMTCGRFSGRFESRRGAP
jgi:hypothetical protein